MSQKGPEFSRRIPLIRIGSEPFRQHIEATADERQKLSARFDLLALDRLVAEVEVQRKEGRTILLEAHFVADFEQACAVTLEPVRGMVADRFSLIYGPDRDEGPELTLCGDEPAFEPLTGDAVDVGEAVAQELSLALPDFPRHPNAAIEEFSTTDASENPFASLARLKRPVES
jgi:uncharacterized metal-binding protein YceD (DUF177 family)